MPPEKVTASPRTTFSAPNLQFQTETGPISRRHADKNGGRQRKIKRPTPLQTRQDKKTHHVISVGLWSFPTQNSGKRVKFPRFPVTDLKKRHTWSKCRRLKEGEVSLIFTLCQCRVAILWSLWSMAKRKKNNKIVKKMSFPVCRRQMTPRMNFLFFSFVRNFPHYANAQALGKKLVSRKISLFYKKLGEVNHNYCNLPRLADRTPKKKWQRKLSRKRNSHLVVTYPKKRDKREKSSAGKFFRSYWVKIKGEN